MANLILIEIPDVADKQLKPGGREKISTDKAKTPLKIENAERSDTGKYKLQLQNMASEETADANFVVIRKPSTDHAARNEDPRRLPPKMQLSTRTFIRGKAGAPIHLEVPLESVPQPTVTWTQDKVTLRNEDRKELVVRENCIELHIPRAQRGDTGTYTIRVQDVFGIDQIWIYITVLDVPAMPEGPLKITRTHEDGCQFDWHPPLDDGGSDILHYVVERMDTDRGTWLEVGQFPSCHAKVTELTPNSRCSDEFRVKAVNFQGESQPLTEEPSIAAKNAFKPEVIDWDASRIDIAWKPPSRDGGAPVKQYIIEKKERGSPGWTECGRVPATKTAFSASGLKEGGEYEFRVTAANEAGLGEPSEPTDPKKAKQRFLTPKILTPARQVKGRAGRPLTFELEYVGEPTPTVTWSGPRGQPLPANVQTDTKEGPTRRTATLLFPATRRQESGPYTFKVENELGKDEAAFEILVQVKPWLDLKGCTTRIVRAGESARFDINIGGEPLPEVTWFKGDEPLKAVGNVAIDTKQEHSVLTIKACKRADGGKYKLTVKNNLGEQSGTCELTVLGDATVLPPPAKRLRPSGGDGSANANASTQRRRRRRRRRRPHGRQLQSDPPAQAQPVASGRRVSCSGGSPVSVTIPSAPAPITSVLLWTVSDVGCWLESLGLGAYRGDFRCHDITGRELQRLDVADLKEIGVTKVGHIKRLQQAMKEL